MSHLSWILTGLVVCMTAAACVSQREWAYKIVATVLVVIALLACSIFFTSAGRSAVVASEAAGEWSPEFTKGIESFMAQASASRWLICLSALGLYAIALRPYRSRKSDAQSGV